MVREKPKTLVESKTLKGHVNEFKFDSINN